MAGRCRGHGMRRTWLVVCCSDRSGSRSTRAPCSGIEEEARMARPSDSDGGAESSRDRDGGTRLARLRKHVAKVSPVADEFRGKDSDVRRASAALRNAMRKEESA